MWPACCSLPEQHFMGGEKIPGSWTCNGEQDLEAHEIAEQIDEPSESDAHAAPAHDWFRRLTAIYVGIVAMLLAIAALGGADATKEMLNANIHASDTYGFYQSKYIRQLHYQTAAEQLELLAADAPGLSPDRTAKVAAAGQTLPRHGGALRKRAGDRRRQEGAAGEGASVGSQARPRGGADAEFRIRRSAAPDRDRARLGRDRGGLALAARRQRRARRLWRRC